MQVLALLLMIVGVTSGVARYMGRAGTPLSGVGGWLFFAGVWVNLAALIAAIWIRRRNQKLVKDARFRLCLRCRYSLTDLEPDGVCPECGKAYTAKGLEEGWARTYPALAATDAQTLVG
jgi:hypothetical protein